MKSIKLTLVIIFLMNSFCFNFGQINSALKYMEEINVEVEIEYLSGDEDEYKSLLLYESGIISEMMPVLISAGIQVDERIEIPKLFLKVTANHNLRNESSENNVCYYITSEIYVVDLVKLKNHPSIVIETITWKGDRLDMHVSEKNAGNISNKNMTKVVKSFVDDYLGANPE